ncbi:hypothetical protein [Bacteroides ovatus]|uniref:OmpH family outer membrane protein n=1 Tax=Bacteroides ovatus TaxID=28116 RepID=A0A1G8FM63_BACOV|nr:hypothetical protein [Bacteroides ovatus]SDH83187.1 hypothetical protein SAMN05192582_101471 [Bacteroides ovatus]
MTKTTTGSSRLTVILSWIIALACFVGGALFIWMMPSPDQGVIDLQAKKQKSPKSVSEKIKKEQSQRALPANYSEQLVKQSEVLVKKNLEDQLRKFQEMAKKMRERKDELLTKVETRQLPRSAPADANDTSKARNIPQAGNPPANASVEDMYALLREYEAEIQQNHLATNAAKQALSRGLSFPEVYNSLKAGASRMPSFDELIRMQVKGGEWNTSDGSNASAGLSIKSTADLNNYRGLLGQATRQAGLAQSRLENLFGVVKQVGKPGGGTGEGNGQPGGSEGGGNGDGGGNGGMGEAAQGNGNKRPMNHYAGSRLNQAMVKAQALPGRRFSKNAERKGWLYINTWYMIGPWDSYGREDFSIVHPPEISVDFDAVYTDGQVGTGIMETDSDPIKVIGEEVHLDGTLRWKFMQSESMHNTVPVTTGNSTYYAYTELYFDEATTMLVAIGTDDSGRVWINGKDVWRDYGTSWYNIDEHIAPFEFRQGWNRVLVRLENGGGGACGFSFLIIPQDK